MIALALLLAQEVDLRKIEEALLKATSPRLEAAYEVDYSPGPRHEGLDVRGTLSIRLAPGDKAAIRVRRSVPKDVEVLALVSDGTRVSLRLPEQQAVVSDVVPGMNARLLKTFVRRGFRGGAIFGLDLARVVKSEEAVPAWDLDGLRAEPEENGARGVSLGTRAWTLRYDPTSFRLLKTVTPGPVKLSRPLSSQITTTFHVWEPAAEHADGTFKD
jgi:hypothetical protein